MAKKDFKNALSETSNLEEVTQSFFSEETLKKAEQKKQEENRTEEKTKRKYTRLKSRVNKTETISFRLTKEDYEKLIKKAEKENYGSISKYIESIIKEVL